MKDARNAASAQLQMPGIPATPRLKTNATPSDLGPGTQVRYIGSVEGGPRHGAIGVVRRTESHRAYVDMGRSGRWHIPFYFLSVPSKAA